MSVLPDLVSKFGLWWPDADPDGLQQAAAAWTTVAKSLQQIGPSANAASARLAATNKGGGIDACRDSVSILTGQIADTATMAHGQAAMLGQFHSEVESARSQVLEIATTIVATIAAGAALSLIPIAGAASAGLTALAVARLVASAAAVGITLSTTVAAIIVGAVECVILDVFVAQPIRIYVFHHGGWSLPEAGASAIGGGIGGGGASKFMAWRTASRQAGLAGGRIEVTEKSIREAMKGAPLKTVQEDAALPKVQRFADRLAAGEKPPPIVVDKGVIVDGNHRYIASRILGREPETVEAKTIGFPPLEPGEEIIPWPGVRIDPLERPGDDVPSF